ncbi:MAG: DUF4388 domain-containing protein [Deltaproteobacteria bacterium]|nr:DUF4388 domain-containing protein [Deltaproteobacteria bacterium]
MSGQPSAIVLDPDLRAARMLELGLAREGVSVTIGAADGAVDLTAASVIVVGGSLDLVRRARAARPDAPILFTGRASRPDAEAAGADELVPRPTYLRDLVTITRLLGATQPDQRDHFTGSLADTTTTLALVRALSTLGRSATLTFIRGLRRGEVRFYKGEVTSAQVGLIHGQAAFHQLLLWTDARFEFHHEDLVRRQQIPLPPDELFADAERFLEGVRESAGSLSPASILEQDSVRVTNLGRQIPTEVHGVLRMFDGHRVLADILEDSPYRVFETLRVAQKALEVGLLRVVENQRKKATWRAVLAIEEWLVGSETRDAVVERTAGLDATAPVPKQPKRNKKRRAKTPPAGVKSQKPDIDWGALVPRVIGAEVGPLAGVVPAAATAGEIEMRTREKPREGLEALMDTDKRDRIFPTEIGLEPSVVLGADAAAEPAPAPTVSDKPGETAPLSKVDLEEPDEWERAEWEAKERALERERVRALAETPPAGIEKAVLPASAPTAETVPEESRDVREARVNESVERMRLERVRREELEARAREEAARGAAADEAKQYAARVKAAADARRAEAERAAEADKAAAKLIALPSIPAPTAPTTPIAQAAPDPATAVSAAPDTTSPPRERTKPSTDARDLVKQLVAEAMPAAEAIAEPAAPIASPEAPTAPQRSVRARVNTPITVAETPAATVSVADTVTVVAAADTAHVTASPTVVIREAPPPVDHMIATPIAPPVDHMVAMPVAVRVDPMVAIPVAPAPTAVVTSESAPVVAGAIAAPSPAPNADPSAPVGDAPSILVADLAAVHSAAARAITGPVVASAPANAASASRELAVAEVRRDAAVAFSDAEEAFFKKAESGPVRTAKIETFDDLDEGYEPPKFWDRVFGRKKPPKR